MALSMTAMPASVADVCVSFAFCTSSATLCANSLAAAAMPRRFAASCGSAAVARALATSSFAASAVASALVSTATWTSRLSTASASAREADATCDAVTAVALAAVGRAAGVDIALAVATPERATSLAAFVSSCSAPSRAAASVSTSCSEAGVSWPACARARVACSSMMSARAMRSACVNSSLPGPAWPADTCPSWRVAAWASAAARPRSCLADGSRTRGCCRLAAVTAAKRVGI
mmetsp:Transcript_1669/g.5368  ORF Transcript_1669/g.5368 Transcript_1669/m.5368 type:complete len:234 (+) Transcript_1669:2440-3141(+)